MAVRFRLLGGVEAQVGGVAVDLGHPKQRAVLGALLVEANRLVSISQLLDRVWGERCPKRGRETIYNYLSRLRTALRAVDDEVRLERRSGGYLLAVDEQAVDVHQFRYLATRARTVRDDQLALELFEQALRLWRSEPLSGLDTPWATGLRITLDDERLAAELDHVDTALRCGRHTELFPSLSARATQYPLDERVAGQMMLALYRSGRQADALEQYQGLRRRLADELGTDPGPAVQRLHQQMLTADPSLAASSTLSVPGPGVAVVPHQLPAAVAHLVGRVRALAALTAQVESAAGVGTVVITSVAGTAGIGKTALAVHWAHQVRDRFPDGQLYVNLRGFDPRAQAMDPAEAVRGFLDALGVTRQHIPPSPEAQIALYRSLLDGKRILVVLDNARDAQQVRPLLPGTAGAVAVVTSRNRLSGLVAVDGAHPISLDLLTEEEARELLVRRLGPGRVAAEPHAVQQIITQCARLPLALTIAATRTAQTGFPLTTLAAELAEAGRRLDVLSADDPASEVRAVFSWSYAALTPSAARLFRLLGLHPGPDVSAAAAASLAALPTPRMQGMLAELARASLLTEHAPGRYAFHDLLRDYATEQANSTDPDEERHAAVHRMLDHYLHTAHAAARLLEPAREPLPLPPPQPGVSPEHSADRERALAWFTTEHAVLLAAVNHAAATGFDAHTWQLAQSLATYLDRRGHWHDLATVGNAAVDAAARLADSFGQPVARSIVARAYRRHGNFDDAYSHLRLALDLFGRAGNLPGQADTYIELARLKGWQGPHAIPEILTLARQAHALYLSCGQRLGQAQTLTAIGWSHARLGDYSQALTCCRQALPLLEEFDDRERQAHAWDSIAYAHHYLGQHSQAVTCYRHALDLCRDLGDRPLEADILNRFGDAHHAAHDPDAAHDDWQHALDILTELGHPHADQIRVKLAALNFAGSALGARARPAARGL
ncbi:BTAD domain-containing putative transcriptional regulator [Streptomyces mirabilis]|uniref:BTAD domain-containing putative transcriptional regulator n=1 Tax=Streptomyces mirabilis TaxID=68239 RepID=A0ABU3V6L4_9ACTN|nr:BTAD domain-containing putative transcriptional regulator [Streptomyces mirabilis]MDU9001817.1 BTAD domain-containing putative transcriptional regulator [Streptomyces mirabilis]